jgi:hypothetical protein
VHVAAPGAKHDRIPRIGEARQVNRQRQDVRVGQALADRIPIVLRAPEHRNEHHGGGRMLRWFEHQRVDGAPIVGPK